MPKIKMYVNTGFASCGHHDEFDIDQEEWDSMSEREKEDLLDELAVDLMQNTITYGAYVVEDSDE